MVAESSAKCRKSKICTRGAQIRLKRALKADFASERGKREGHKMKVRKKDQGR